MGQQQLLLLVFGIVLAGGAVVAGAHALEGANQPTSHDSVFQEALAIVADLQVWKLKPYQVGGGAAVRGFDHVSFRSIGYSHTLLSNRVHKTDQGCYMLRTIGPGHHAELTISAPSCAAKHFVARVVVRGRTAADIDWYHEPASILPGMEP
jgi:hypothetical protein